MLNVSSMSDSPEAAVKDAAPPSAPKPSQLPTILGLVNTLMLIGVLVFLVLGRNSAAAVSSDSEAAEEKPEKAEKAEKSEKGEKAEKPEKGEKAEKGEKGAKGGSSKSGQMVKLADFVVHLRNPESDRYARVAFEVEVATDNDRELVTEQMPKIRDAFISYLSDRTAEELRGSENLDHTKEALSAQMAKLLPDVRTRGLYISDFVIQ